MSTFTMDTADLPGYLRGMIEDRQELLKLREDKRLLEEEVERLHGIIDAQSEAIQKSIDNAQAEKNNAEKSGNDYIALREDYRKACNDVDKLQGELAGVRGALKHHVESEQKKAAEAEAANVELNKAKEENACLRSEIDDLRESYRLLDAKLKRQAAQFKDNPIVAAVANLPSWSWTQSYNFEGSETQKIIAELVNFMAYEDISDSEDLHRLLESAKDYKDKKEKLDEMSDAFDTWINEMPSSDLSDY